MLTWLDANLVSMVNGVAVGLLIFLMAAGLSLTFGQANVLNLAHGSLFMVGAYLASSFGGGQLTVATLLICLAVSLVLGAGGGLALMAAVKPIAHRGYLDQALLTLGIALVCAEVVVMVWGNDVKSISAPASLNGSIDLLGHSYPAYRVVIIGVGLVAALGLMLVIERTRAGALVRAGVEDAVMLSAMGVNPALIRYAVFASGGALAAGAGVIGAPLLGAHPGLDHEVLILALITVTIGGLGSIRGALIGALIIGQIQVLGVAVVPSYAGFLLFAAMAAVLLLRPAGLYPLPQRRFA